MSDQRTKDIIDGMGDAGGSEADRQASAHMVSALRAHRDQVSGIASIPLQDEHMSSALLASARSRSQELRKAATKASASERPIPLWLVLAWLAALIGFIILWSRAG